MGEIKKKENAFPDSNYSLSYIQNLHELVEIMSESLENPVTIEAPNFELIAYSSNYREIDQARQKTILGKKVPHNIVSVLKQNGTIALIETTEGAIRIPAIEEVGLLQRVTICIRHQSRILGYIWVQETTHMLSELELYSLKEFAHHAARIIIDTTQYRRIHKETIDNFFWSVIQGNLSNERILKIEAELAGVILPHLFSIVVFSIASSIDIDTLRSLIRVYCSYIGKTTYWIEKDEQIVVILGSPSVIEGSSTKLAEEFVQKILQKIDKRTQQLINIGIGKEYSQITLAKKSYLEAQEVINITKSLNKKVYEFPISFQKLGIYRLLPTIYDKNTADGYINEHIWRLAKYDVESQSQLLLTLEAFLRNNCKMKETADNLHIHPNTLNYRLKRINEITDLNLDDFTQRMMLYIDLMLVSSFKGQSL